MELQEENKAKTMGITELSEKIVKLDEEINNLKDRNSVNNSLNSEALNEERLAEALADLRN